MAGKPSEPAIRDGPSEAGCARSLGRSMAAALDGPLSMDSADRLQAAWARAAEGRALSADLSRLMPSVCAEIERRPTDLRALWGRLEALLVFVGSPEGRTDPNCRAVDLFFCMPEEFGWDVDWSHLPESVQNILEDLGGTLHDAVTHPEIAENVESTPEQLLGRVRGIPL